MLAFDELSLHGGLYYVKLVGPFAVYVAFVPKFSSGCGPEKIEKINVNPSNRKLIAPWRDVPRGSAEWAEVASAANVAINIANLIEDGGLSALSRLGLSSAELEAAAGPLPIDPEEVA